MRSLRRTAGGDARAGATDRVARSGAPSPGAPPIDPRAWHRAHFGERQRRPRGRLGSRASPRSGGIAEARVATSSVGVARDLRAALSPRRGYCGLPLVRVRGANVDRPGNPFLVTLVTAAVVAAGGWRSCSGASRPAARTRSGRRRVGSSRRRRSSSPSSRSRRPSALSCSRGCVGDRRVDPNAPRILSLTNPAIGSPLRWLALALAAVAPSSRGLTRDQLATNSRRTARLARGGQCTAGRDLGRRSPERIVGGRSDPPPSSGRGGGSIAHPES